jgi:hypothetical protein
MRRVLLLFSFIVLPMFPFSRAAADMSPEFYFLAWEIKRNFESSAVATRGPECLPDCRRLANEALRDMLKREAVSRVVVQPLENGAKFALSALGLPNVAMTTFNVVECYLNESSVSGFRACLWRELIGLGMQETLSQAYGWDNLSNTFAGAAWEKAFEAIRGSVDSYQASSETAIHTAERNCSVGVSLRWDKRRRPESKGGRIFVHFSFNNCRCPTGSSVRSGTLQFYVPVHHVPAGSRQPGFTVGEPTDYKVQIQCCRRAPGDDRAHLFNGAFQWKGLMKDPEEETTPPPPQPEPPRQPEPPPPPPPPPPVWSEELPCPECQPFLDLALRHAREAEELEQQMPEVRDRIDNNRQRQQAVRGRIARLQNEIAGKAGQGGSSHDPETGITIDSWTQADGSVKVTVKDKDGNTIDERTRPRRDTDKLRRELEEEQKELERLENELNDLQAELDRLTRGRDTQRKLEADARRELAECVRVRCLGGVAAEPEEQKPASCTFPAPKPVIIGPKEAFGEKSMQQKVEEKAKGMVGEAIGGAIGGALGGGGRLGGLGSPRSGGGKKPDGPATVRDPVKDKVLLTAPGGTAIKTGIGPDPKKGMRVSVDVEDSPAKGVVHTIHRETLDENCEPQYQMPSEYWLYKIWAEWSISVWWRKDTYVDNQLVKREEGGWQKQGTTMLASGIFDASKDAPFTAWGQLGFDRAFGGPRNVGATFPPAAAQGRPERYVIHVSEPQQDPVMTTPFAVYPVQGQGGKLTFTDQQPDWSAAGVQ